MKMMNVVKIKKQMARTESMLASADSQRTLLWDMLLPYMSEEFHDESCYIDEVKGDGLVVVFEEAFNFIRNYPVSQIIALIEDGAKYITRNQLTAI